MLAIAMALGATACGSDDGDPMLDDSGSSGTDDGTETGSAGLDSSSGPGSSGSETSSGGDDSSSDSTGSDPTLLEEVVDAIGGPAALEGLQTLRVVSMGESQITEEGFEPGASFPTTTFLESAELDLEAGALRIDVDRTVSTFGTPTGQTFYELVVGERGWISAPESLFGLPAGEMGSDRLASELRQQRLLHPHLLLRDAWADPSLVTVGEPEDGFELLVIADPVHPITLWIDPRTKLIDRATTLENDHVYRDVEIEITYDGWSGDELSFPSDVVLSVRNLISRTESRTAVEVNPTLDAADFEFPEPAAGEYSPDDAERGARNHHFHQVWANAGLPRDGLDLQIVPVAVPGHDNITLLTGPSSYNTLVVEREDAVTVVETPLYAARCEAVIAWIEANIDKPIDTVVVTHHHYDHSACARTIVGAGGTLIASQGAEAFWTEVLEAPSTVEPDRLAEAGTEPELTTFSGSFTSDDGGVSLGVYEVTTEHAADMAMIVVDGVVFSSDLYSPGFTQLLPYGPGDLLEAIEQNELLEVVDGIVGGHGAEVHTIEQLQAAAG